MAKRDDRPGNPRHKYIPGLPNAGDKDRGYYVGTRKPHGWTGSGRCEESEGLDERLRELIRRGW